MSGAGARWREAGPTRCRSLGACFAILLLSAAAAAGSEGGGEASRPRLLVLTDIGGDPDDEQSLVRLLVHANEVDIEGICATSRLEHGHDTRPDLAARLVGAYGQVEPRLRLHAPGYPPAADLARGIKGGLGDPSLLGAGHESEASEWIVRRADAEDPRPLWVAVWGGSRELAQALWSVRASRRPEEVQRLIGRLRVHMIGDQDGHRRDVIDPFPGLFLIANGIVNQGRAKLPELSAYRGQYQTGERATLGRAWVDAHVREGHGPLGALYPRDGGGVPGMKEGDTPSFLGLVANGLNLPDGPERGGWGGRYRRVRGRLFADAQDFQDGVWNERHTVSRWRRAVQNEFAARMDWCVAARFEDANHPPRPVVDGDPGLRPLERTIVPGCTLRLDASSSTDPDGDPLTFRWWVYHEASGILAQSIPLSGADSPRVALTAPALAGGGALELVLEVEDRGIPPLTRYRRVRVRVGQVEGARR